MPQKNGKTTILTSKTRLWLISLCLLALLLSACDVRNPPRQTTPTPASTLKPILNKDYTPEPTSLPATATPTATFTATLPPTVTPTPKIIMAALLPIAQIQLESPHYAWGSDLQQRRIFRSVDSGTTWKEVTPPDATNGEYYSGSVVFLGANEAWLLVSKPDETSVLFHTIDAGVSWNKTDLPFPGGQMSFSRLDGATEATGVILADLGVGAGSNWVAVYASTDSGKTWSQTFTHTPGEGESSLPAGGIKSSMTYDGKNDLWITGSMPVDNFLYLYRSTDLGKSWAAQSCEMQQVAESVMYETYKPVWVTPDEGFLPIRVFYGSTDMKTVFCHTVNHGADWQFLSILEETSFQSFLDETHGWVGSANRLLRTSDGGHTWEDLSAAIPAGESIVSMDFGTGDIGVLITNPSNFDNPNENKLYLSIDGGTSWSLLPTSLNP